ncbi:MAG: hypothetical protein RMJ43_03075, partial [Chloroherpetonaceae bacterium]|nr:hypothetical protein [Chloroherpetonaceae bacterium]
MDGPVDMTPPSHTLDARKTFLLKLYDQLYNSINRYYTIVWQTFAVILGLLGALDLVAKRFLSLSEAAILAVLICTWMIAHTLDAALWMNRNMAIITNIERQFLESRDMENIH